jgi:hypothetical protein
VGEKEFMASSDDKIAAFGESIMTRKDAVLLASRALALYLIAWGLNDLSYVPQAVLSFRHNTSVLYTNSYLRTYYGLALVVHVLRSIALFVAAAWLYRCRGRVQAFFLPPETSASLDGIE